VRKPFNAGLVRRFPHARPDGAKGAPAHAQTVFKTVAFVRSAILPARRLPRACGGARRPL